MQGLEIYGEIGDGGITAKTVSEKLAKIDVSAGVEICFNSGGGDAFEGIAIYNILKQWPGKKRARINGVAAGIASLIAMAADEIVIDPRAVIIIMEPTQVCGAQDAADAISVLETTADAMANIYAERTGNQYAQVKKWMIAETSFTADDAIKYGFADKMQ